MAQRVKDDKPGIRIGAGRTTMREVIRHGKLTVVLDDFLRMFRPNWRAIAEDNTLGRTELRVLLLSAVSLGPDNRIQLSQRDMAERLRITPQSVNRAIHVLVACGYVFQDGHRYSLNSRLVADHKEVTDLLILRRRELRRLASLKSASCANVNSAAKGTPAVSIH